MELRDYQSAAIGSLYRHLQAKQNNPCIVIPTGGGKSLVMATVCRDAVVKWGGKVILLAHVRELLSQTFDHLKKVDPTLPVGIYSAGLGEKNPDEPVTVAGIQSAFRNPDAFTPPDLVIVDEAHRIPEDGEGMYRTFISALKERNPNLRVIGFTATPYRLTSGPICTPENILNEVCIEVPIHELIAKGFLCPVVAYGGGYEEDFSQVSTRGGEFIAGELEDFLNDDVKVATAVCEMVGRMAGRKSILVFASGVAHGKKIAQMLQETTEGEAVGQVYGETSKDLRDAMTRDFRSGKIRWLVNCDVLTLGFDAPNVDGIGILRATMSPGLYYQMVGRGFRIAEGKKDCMVLDFGGNALRHGPVDAIDPEATRKGRDGDGEAPCKKCPECLRYVPAGVLTCETCGHAFPPRKPTHDATAYNGGILSGDATPYDATVEDVDYSSHIGKESGITSLKVTYHIGLTVFNEYVCLEHTGFARAKAEAWWARRASVPAPTKVSEAFDFVETLIVPKQIRIRQSGKYPEIIGYQFG